MATLATEVTLKRDKATLVLVDLMSITNGLVANTFTKISHHRNVSVMHLTQNLFDKNKYAGSRHVGSASALKGVIVPVDGH